MIILTQRVLDSSVIAKQVKTCSHLHQRQVLWQSDLRLLNLEGKDCKEWNTHSNPTLIHLLFYKLSA